MALCPVAETIPPEILEEFVRHTVGTTALRNISFVCKRWRDLSQERLFQRLVVDPLETHDLYKPEHTRLAKYVRDLHIANLSGSTATTEPPPSMPLGHFTDCADFLCQLSAPRSLQFLHSRLKWEQIPQVLIDAFIVVTSRPSFRCLAVRGMKRFPVPLFVRGPNLQLDIRGIQDPFFDDIAAGSSLKYLSLGDEDSIRTFLSYCLPRPKVSAQWFRTLSTLSLKFREFNPTAGAVVQVVGGRLEELKVDATLNFGRGGYLLPQQSLRTLTRLKRLTIVLRLQRIPGEDIQETATSCLTKFLPVLPSPPTLTDFLFDCRFPLMSKIATNQRYGWYIKNIANHAGALFLKRPHALKTVIIIVHLFGCDDTPDPFPTINGAVWVDALVGLRDQGVNVYTLVTDPTTRCNTLVILITTLTVVDCHETQAGGHTLWRTQAGFQ
ncbi:hypothetical protein P691DRAFT_787951 [Macrolepiota fuliginosa MF-IS2]|uniref:F-box domain-containing protein n=1 Tax=Macrolepiota fuliginosa MF-IS2 TaxID=1400762 RepID=A0A9P5X2B7_9AGAR|nr:hypothetical protein P691DRAFT_787951 [Macrolepiota fuliginosa MF-IS2]